MLIGNAFANLTAVPKPIVFVIMALSGIGPLWFIQLLWIFFDIIAIGLGIAYTVLYFGENYAVEPVINNVLACTFCWFARLAKNGASLALRNFPGYTIIT